MDGLKTRMDPVENKSVSRGAGPGSVPESPREEQINRRIQAETRKIKMPKAHNSTRKTEKTERRKHF